VSDTIWNVLKWVAVLLLMFATTILLSPHVAATAITPWAIYIVGNVIWMTYAYRQRDWALISTCAYYFAIDTVIVYSRMFDPHLLASLQTVLSVLDKLP
jgi:hypothetical protein